MTMMMMMKRLLAALLVMYYVTAMTPGQRLFIGVSHDTEQLEQTFWDVADPQHEQYQQYHQVDQLRRLLGSEYKIIDVVEWLETLGVNKHDIDVVPTGDAIFVNNWMSDELPKDFDPELVDFVYIIRDKKSGLFTQKPQTEGVGSSLCSPDNQKKSYGMSVTRQASNDTNSQMVWGTGTFGYHESDLQMFYENYLSDNPGCNVDNIAFDEENKWDGKTGDNFFEGTLDVSYVSAFGPGIKTIVANSDISVDSEAGEAFGGAFLNFLIDLNARDEVPYVLSLSLGSLSAYSCELLCENYADAVGDDDSYDTCRKYVKGQFQVCMYESTDIQDRIDNELMKLGLRGVTVVGASGDGGSHFSFGRFKSDTIGSKLNDIVCESMNMPVYPTGSPYILSVGGTQFSGSFFGPSCSAESPCGWTDGGGGFALSTNHDRPSYQGSIPDDYISRAQALAPQTMCADGTYNIKGRAYPDVSALAQVCIPLCTNGKCSGSGGTSASAPTVGGMISMINDARLNSDLPPLGFFNTKLYQLMDDASVYAECFNDVGYEEIGNFWSCESYSTCKGCDTGFPATKGWDAQTGFGQPRFEGWLKHLGSDTSVPQKAEF